MGIREDFVRKVFNIRVKYFGYEKNIKDSKHISIANSNVVMVFCLNKQEDNTVIYEFINGVANEFQNLNFVVVAQSNKFIVNQKNDDVIYISPMDITITGKMNSEKSNWIKNNNFDILFSFNNFQNQFYNNVISMISASLKCGKYHSQQNDIYDITIKHDSRNYSEQLAHYTHYISTLNIKK